MNLQNRIRLRVRTRLGVPTLLVALWGYKRARVYLHIHSSGREMVIHVTRIDDERSHGHD